MIARSASLWLVCLSMSLSPRPVEAESLCLDLRFAGICQTLYNATIVGYDTEADPCIVSGPPAYQVRFSSSVGTPFANSGPLVDPTLFMWVSGPAGYGVNAVAGWFTGDLVVESMDPLVGSLSDENAVFWSGPCLDTWTPVVRLTSSALSRWIRPTGDG